MSAPLEMLPLLEESDIEVIDDVKDLDEFSKDSETDWDFFEFNEDSLPILMIFDSFIYGSSFRDDFLDS